MNEKTNGAATPYVHARYERMRQFLRWMVSNTLWRWMVRIDDVSGLENLPETGPAILMINHIAFIDPVVVLGTMPRNIVPIAKREVYDDPIWGILPQLWHVIPVDRSGNDLSALKKALKVLEAGEVLLIAPEGTRHESLRDIKEGIGFLAYKSGAPVVPVAVENTDGFPTLRRSRLAQPGATVKLGRPVRVVAPDSARLRREALGQVTRELMYALAAILPENRRGEFADLENATTQYIEYMD